VALFDKEEYEAQALLGCTTVFPYGEKMSQDETIQLAHVLTQPQRFRIVDLLRSRDRAYIAEIADELDIDRKVVSFHLRVLERENLLTTSLEKKEPPGGNPILVRYAKLTDKTLSVLKKCGL